MFTNAYNVGFYKNARQKIKKNNQQIAKTKFQNIYEIVKNIWTCLFRLMNKL